LLNVSINLETADELLFELILPLLVAFVREVVDPPRVGR
jgi:hypothetical protein